MDHSVEHIPNGSSGHEEREVDVRTIVVSLAALLVGAMLTAFLTIGIFRYFHTANKVDQTAKENPQQIPPEPRVEERPYEQLITVRAREERILNSYAWVDKKEGAVRVPIANAIDMLAQKGLPSHDYLGDMLAGRKPPMPPKAPPQGSKNAK
ncbi:MAG TPA: hypothetical protein VIX89_19015 [Bryobacteraceae bacterium]